MAEANKQKKWRNVTEYFSEERRHYNNTYLEIDEVYADEVEVSLFSSEEGDFEIYISYGKMYGIIYVSKEDAKAKREEIKKVLEAEYQVNRKPTDQFMKKFIAEFNLCLPGDVLFS